MRKSSVAEYRKTLPTQKLASKLTFHNPIEYSLFVRKRAGNKSECRINEI